MRRRSGAGLIGPIGPIGLIGLVSLSLVFACGGGEGEAAKAGSDAPAAPAPGEPAAPSPPALPDAAELLAGAVAAAGGAEAIAAVTSYYAEAQMSAPKLGLSGVGKTWWKGGDFYTESDMPGVGLSRQGGQGDEIWGDDPILGPRTIRGIEAEQVRWSAEPWLVAAWRRHFDRAETTAVVEQGGRKLAEITLTSKSGDTMVLRIDLETKEPASQSFTQVNPLGSMPVTVHFKDYREVNGVRVPFVSEIDATLTQLTSTTTKFEIGVEVDPSRFVSPRAGQGAAAGAPAPPAAK